MTTRNGLHKTSSLIGRTTIRDWAWLLFGLAWALGGIYYVVQFWGRFATLDWTLALFVVANVWIVFASWRRTRWGKKRGRSEH